MSETKNKPIELPIPRRSWEPWEEDLCRKLYPLGKRAELHAALPHRSWTGIKIHSLRTLKVRRSTNYIGKWSLQMERDLARMYPRLSKHEVQRYLNARYNQKLTLGAIVTRAWRLKLTRPAVKWTPGEDRMLRQEFTRLLNRVQSFNPKRSRQAFVSRILKFAYRWRAEERKASITKIFQPISEAVS